MLKVINFEGEHKVDQNIHLKRCIGTVILRIGRAWSAMYAAPSSPELFEARLHHPYLTPLSPRASIPRLVILVGMRLRSMADQFESIRRLIKYIRDVIACTPHRVQCLLITFFLHWRSGCGPDLCCSASYPCWAEENSS